MRVRVTRSFPYSPRGWDNAVAHEGVQELPDHIAESALAEGWAEREEPVGSNEPVRRVRPRKATR